MMEKNAHPRYAKLSGNPTQLVMLALSGLGQQEWGPQALRPWVHMADPNEALEKALWCYERGMIPVVTERDPALAIGVAERWGADLLVCDAQSLRDVASRLPQSVRAVSVIDADFPEDLEALVPGRDVRRIPRA